MHSLDNHPVENHTSRAQVRLPAPTQTLRRLCKHFSHKVEAEWSEADGRVDFAIGTCVLRARQECLHLECDASSRQDLQDIEQTLERHLPQMCGSHESPKLHWLR